MGKKMVLVREPKHKEVDINLKHEIEFIIKSS